MSNDSGSVIDLLSLEFRGASGLGEILSIKYTMSTTDSPTSSMGCFGCLAPLVGALERFQLTCLQQHELWTTLAVCVRRVLL